MALRVRRADEDQPRRNLKVTVARPQTGIRVGNKITTQQTSIRPVQRNRPNQIQQLNKSNIQRFREGLQTQALGAQRSGVGFLQGFSGLADLAPGRGTSSLSKRLDEVAKGIDQRAEALGSPSSLYRSSQLVGDIAGLATGGGAIAKGLSTLGKTGKGIQIVGRGSQALDRLAKTGKAGNVTAKGLRIAASPQVAADVGLDITTGIGQKASKDEKVTGLDVALNTIPSFGLGVLQNKLARRAGRKGDDAVQTLTEGIKTNEPVERALKIASKTDAPTPEIPAGIKPVIDFSDDLRARVADGKIDGQLKNVPIDDLKRGEGVSGVKLDAGRVSKYLNDLRQGNPIDPVVVSRKGDELFLEDGQHRLEAFKQAGITEAPAVETITDVPQTTGVRVVGEAPEETLRVAPTQADEVPEAIAETAARADEAAPVASQGASQSTDPNLTTPARAQVEAPQRQAQVAQGSVDIDPTDPFGNRSPVQRLRNEFAQAFIDEDAPLINLLRKSEKDLGIEGLTEEFLFDTNVQRASNAIANNRLKNSPGFTAAIKGLDTDGIAQFDEFAAAVAELSNITDRGLASASKELDELRRIVDEGKDVFGERFEALNQFYKEIAEDLRAANLISEERFASFQADDNYIRVQRDMTDIADTGFTGSRSRSIGSTTAAQKRTGSTREVLSPVRTAARRAQELQQEIQRNITATNLIDTLQNLGLAKEVSPDRVGAKNVMKRLVDGQPQAFEVPADIKNIVDNVAPYQLGALQKIISAPTRVFRAGTTGLNVPFAVTNYLRDQSSSAIYSKNVRATHSPQAVAQGLWEGTKDFIGTENSEAWDKFIKYAGDQTIFDETRNAKETNRVIREISQGAEGRFINSVTAPLRTLEDLISVTEKATRFQNFKGMYNDALSRGLGEEQATRIAVQAAFQNSVNFQRSGRYSRVLNLMVPYFNAGIQGSRNVVRSFRDRPMATTAKSVAFLGIPVLATTLYNQADPERKEVYDKLPDYIKEDNFVVIQDGKAYLAPKPQGYRELVDPIRRFAEGYANDNPVDALKIATDIANAASGPLDISSENPSRIVTGLIPQAMKPIIQQVANVDFYTGNEIVPDYLKEENPLPQDQTYKNTSGTARYIADVLGASPIQVEKFVNDTFGSLGRYTLNASDNVLAAQGQIPEEQIGGRSILNDFERRLVYTPRDKSKGAIFFDNLERIGSEIQDPDDRAVFEALHKKDPLPGMLDSVEKYTNYLNRPAVLEADRKLDQLNRQAGDAGNPMFDLTPDQLQKVLVYRQAKILRAGKQVKDKNGVDLYVALGLDEKWYENFKDKEQNFYDSLDLPEKEQATFSGGKKPEVTAEMQGLLDTYYGLPKGTGQRSMMLRAYPEILDYWNASNDFTNRERAAIGLKPIDNSFDGSSGSGGSGGSRSGGSRSGSRRVSNPKVRIKESLAAGPSVKLKAPKNVTGKSIIAKAKKVKVKSRKPSSGGKIKIRRII